MTVVLRVQDLVHRKRPQLAETDSTLAALQRFLLGVRVHVVSKVVLPPETLSTVRTGEGTLIRVSPLVDHHVVALGEFSMAELADEPFLGTRAPVLVVAEIQSGIIGGWGGRGGCRGGEQS